MNDSSELLPLLEALCSRYPHWRFGQLMANVAGWADANIWDVEDAQLVAACKKHLDRPNSAPQTAAIEVHN